MASTAAAQGSLGAIHVRGTERYSEQSVVQCSGLHVGDAFSQDALNAAMQRLVDSGFFLSANYSYEPVMKNGKALYTVTLQVKEDATSLAAAVIDIPGVDGVAMLADLGKQDGLLAAKLPDDDAAQSYYQHQIEAALAKAGHPQTLTIKREGTLGGGGTTLVFRPAQLPALARLQFANNRAIDGDSLERAVHSVVVGQGYSERELRQALTLNLTPLYEERGYLHVTYPKVSVDQSSKDGVVVTVAVDEEHTWNLGAVDLIGDGLPVDAMQSAARFPTGKLANWKQIEASVEDMQKPLRATGYLARRVAKPIRTFHPESGTVDLKIPVAKGPQYAFGELQLNGFPPSLEQQARRNWKVSSGSPYDEIFGTAYYKQLYEGINDPKMVLQMKLAPQPGSYVVNAVFTLKPRT